VARFLAEYERSARFANNSLEETAKLVAEYGIAAEAIALKAIPKCNITFIKGNEMKSVLSAYLETLYNANSASVGGALPSESFYYVAE
jgi:NitT/TauT family transport system substrate-binding protein